MDSIKTPYFEQQPLFFAQYCFRRNLQAKKASSIINVFKDALYGADVHLNNRFIEGEDIRSLIYERASFIDCILHYAWHQFEWSNNIALIAVGGYGRRELHPKSDIDLLILMDVEIEQDLQSTQQFLLLLWDIGLDIGHSVRTLEQCIEIAEKDITVVTNITECRTVVGNHQLNLELRKKTLPDKMWPMIDFFNAKWEEQQQRHDKYNDTEYSLEPNVKNAPGGLRDIQTIAWVAKRHFGVGTLNQLGGKGFFTEEEFAVLLSGEEFLWKVRYGLHKLAGRAEERLLFDYQRQLATDFGFKDTEKSLAVEQFMRRYYRVVVALREINDVLMHYLNDEVLNHNGSATITPINSRFQLRDNYIETTHPEVFSESPSAMLEIFVHMGSNDSIIGARPETIRLLREHRDLIDENFRQSEENTNLFLQLLQHPKGLTTQLRRMTRYNILGRYLPEFDNIIGQMQFDLFHIYTVDQHTLAVIGNIAALQDPLSKEKYPIAYNCMQSIPKPELLFIAGLYHDIAKGRGGDHSTLGAVDAMGFCVRHRLKLHEARLVAWLVEKHLLMSSFSQKRDLSDPDVIHEFALEMGDQMHLNYLFALTVADVNATNPNLWTTWRASLMRQLYSETRRALRRGLENPIDQSDIIDETQENAMQLLLDKGINQKTVERVWSYLGHDYFLHEHSDDIAWQTEAIIRHDSIEDLVLVRETTELKDEGATEIFIRTKDRNNVFLAVASTLDQLNLSIQDARIYNADRGGYTIDTFYVLDDNNQPIGNNPKLTRTIQEALLTALLSTSNFNQTIHRLTPRRLKNFSTPTRTSISNDIRSNATVLEVITPDRPGLLATIARVFLKYEIQLNSAKITTLGERVEDIFYISDAHGDPLSEPEFCRELETQIRTELDQKVQVSNANSTMKKQI